jgi:hypothetical protein
MNPSEWWQQILVAPADAELKAQYVEALTRAGDWRAEIFAAANEYARLRAGSLIHRAAELKPLRDRLLADWRADFAPRADAWAGEIEFVIGWPVELTISASDFVRHAAEIVATMPLRHLNLKAIGETPTVFEVPQLDQIASLKGNEQAWRNHRGTGGNPRGRRVVAGRGTSGPDE